MSDYHYHVSFVDGPDINEPDFEKFLLAVAQHKGREIENDGIDYGTICRFGCGQLHDLTTEEEKRFKKVAGIVEQKLKLPRWWKKLF